jgi:hypothetical protein
LSGENIQIFWKRFFILILFYLFIKSFLLFYSEIEFIKPLDDVKIQRKTITFTEDYNPCTVFMNKIINSVIMKMFIFFYSIYIYIFYFVSQVLCFCTDEDDGGWFSMRNIFLFAMILFFFYSIIWGGIGIASESKLDVIKHDSLIIFVFICSLLLLSFFFLLL